MPPGALAKSGAGKPKRIAKVNIYNLICHGSIETV